MTAKKTSPPHDKPVQAPVPAWGMQADAGRQQITVAAESASAMVRGLEAMRKVNDRAVQKALLRYTLAAKMLSAARQPADLLSMPSDLIRSEFDSATSYWQELSAAAMEMQAELLGCSSHLIDSDAVLQVASAVKSMPALNGWSSFLRCGQLA